MPIEEVDHPRHEINLIGITPLEDAMRFAFVARIFNRFTEEAQADKDFVAPRRHNLNVRCAFNDQQRRLYAIACLRPFNGDAKAKIHLLRQLLCVRGVDAERDDVAIKVSRSAWCTGAPAT